MVPTDQPELAYDMIMEFIRTKKISHSSGSSDIDFDEQLIQ